MCELVEEQIGEGEECVMKGNQVNQKEAHDGQKRGKHSL